MNAYNDLKDKNKARYLSECSCSYLKGISVRLPSYVCLKLAQMRVQQFLLSALGIILAKVESKSYHRCTLLDPSLVYSTKNKMQKLLSKVRD